MLKVKEPNIDIDILESRLKVANEDALKRAAEEAVSLHTKELDTKLGGSGSGSKIKEILAKAKSGNLDSNISCPTCKHNGHSHALKDIGGGKVKCTGDSCGEEYALIPTKDVPDYQCKTCSSPHHKPKNKDDEALDNCPYCGSTEFIKSQTDYKKIREKTAKQNQNQKSTISKLLG